ncbi:MAG: hypothetical protein GXX79_10105 [Actinomycetales bacterium]|nr:hypothetical protein [Actinomycetales bacterium]
MDPLDTLCEAVRTTPVPGAPPSISRESAAVGLAFLDTALRQNHVRRLTERLELVEHRLARRTTELDISLGLLDAEQRDAAELFRTMRNHDPDGAGRQGAELLWVPVARVAQEWEAPIAVVSAEGARLPRLTQYETSRLLAAGLYQLLKGILSSLPESAERSDLSRLLYSEDESRWLLQSALSTLLAERHKPRTTHPRPGTDRHGARHRELLLGVLDRHAPELDTYRELLGVALHDNLLVVGLDGRRDEHLLSYDSPPLVGRGHPIGPAGVLRWLRRSGSYYRVDYRTAVPANLRAYHLVAETEGSVEIARMHLVTSADVPRVRGLGEDLLALAARLEATQAAEGGGRAGGRRVLEWELQTVLRTLAEVVRSRRWEADQAGITFVEDPFPVSGALAWAGAPEQADARGSLLDQPEVGPGALRAAAAELEELELRSDLSLASDPESNRAHVYWRRSGAPSATGRRVGIRVTAVLRDSVHSRADSIIGYLLALMGITYLVAAMLTGSPWPFGVFPGRRAGDNADAVVAVLLLVPGFIYTRLDLPPPRSIAARVHLLTRGVADLAIGIMIVIAATVAIRPESRLLVTILEVAAGLQVTALLVLLAQRRGGFGQVPVPASVPRWARLGAARVGRTRPDADFTAAWTDGDGVRADG